jgi:hypothetical protein
MLEEIPEEDSDEDIEFYELPSLRLCFYEPPSVRLLHAVRNIEGVPLRLP